MDWNVKNVIIKKVLVANYEDVQKRDGRVWIHFQIVEFSNFQIFL